MSTETFEARYQVDDGYAGGSRPQHFRVHPSEIQDDMSDEEIADLYTEMCEEDMRQKIGCSPERIDKFVKWARDVLNNRTDEADHA